MSTPHALYEQGLDAFRAGEEKRSRDLNQRSLELAEELGDRVGQAWACIGLCRLAFRAGDYEEGRRLTARARDLASGELKIETRAVHMEAEMLRAERRYAEAAPLYEDNAARWRELGDDGGVAMEKYNLAAVCALMGEGRRALSLAREALEGALAEGDESLVVYSVAGIGAALAADEPERALRLLAAARAVLASRGEVLDPAEETEFEELEAGAAARLGSEATERARVEGAELPFEAAVADARALGS